VSVFYKLSKEQKELAKYLRLNPIKGARVTSKGGVLKDPDINLNPKAVQSES
jgi:hypothetical protein